jgi:hypothetical protein
MELKDGSQIAGAVDELWEGLQSRRIVRQLWPSAGEQSYLEWRSEFDPEGAHKLREDFEFVRRFAVMPIIAVAGLINSGKSSLVASFLSPEGRDRVLRGQNKSQGTQRFTLWLPCAWKKEDGLCARLDQMLANVFGHAPELLHAERERAHAQQSSIEDLSAPLLAFDEGLDSLRMALLDCPDVQRVQPGEQAGRNRRLEILKAAGEVCAGVILVAPRMQIEIKELRSIAMNMPSATRIYAINFLFRESAEALLADAKDQLEGEICYVAYDHHKPANRGFAPLIDPNFTGKADPDFERRVPFFFEALPDPDKNRPDAVTEERSLLQIGARLSPESLRQRRQSELVRSLRRNVGAALGNLEQKVAERADELEKAHEGLFERLLDLMQDDNGNLRIKLDPEITASITESICRTAPWDMRMMLLFNKKLIKGILAVKAGVGKAWGLLQAVGGRTSFLKQKKKLDSYHLEPERLLDVLVVWSAGFGPLKEKNFWIEDAGAIVERFRSEERTNLTAAQWDAMTTGFWETAPRFKARVVLVLSLLTVLAAALWTALEPFSGSVVFAATVKGNIVALTITELAGLLGLGGGIAALIARLLHTHVERRIGSQQFSNLFAIACDQLGLPRETPPLYAGRFPPPHIAEKRKREAYGTNQRGWLKAQINRQELHQLQLALSRV